MKIKFKFPRDLRDFLILWSTQSFSALGSAMTSFALVVWSYQQQGSALTTAMLSICSYTPYVVMSIFAGALSDRWDKKRTMLFCDGFAALTTVAALMLLKSGGLRIGHIYFINALNGLMNTVQQPASDVAVSLLTPPERIQRVGGLRALSYSLVTVLSPMLATAMLTLFGLDAVMAFDLLTCAVAMIALAGWVRIPRAKENAAQAQPILTAAREGLRYLRGATAVMQVILLLAGINFIASIYNAALPAMALSRQNGGEAVLGWINAASGAAMLLGSGLASMLPAPRDRRRVIYNCLLISMSTENLLLALGRSAPVWCLGAVLGWLFIPLMNANVDAMLRETIPIDMQGRVYSVRNTLQFFTIPLGYLAGGALVDGVMEPLMARQAPDSWLIVLFGEGKGSGAAALFFVLALAGTLLCLTVRMDHKRSEPVCKDADRDR